MNPDQIAATLAMEVDALRLLYRVVDGLHQLARWRCQRTGVPTVDEKSALRSTDESPLRNQFDLINQRQPFNQLLNSSSVISRKGLNDTPGRRLRTGMVVPGNRC